MRPAAFALTPPAVWLGLLASAATVAPTAAQQLQWQATGVRPVSHAAARAPRPQSPQRRVPKAPTYVRTAAPQPAPAPTPPAPQALAAQPNPGTSATPPSIPAVTDAAVQPVGFNGHCDCGAPGCTDGMVTGPMVEGPMVGATMVEGGVMCGEPTCGLTYGDACGCGDIGCGGACGDALGCGDACGCDDAAAVPLMLYVPAIKELTIGAGVQAFKNPLDNGRDRGNFGFNHAINLGGRVPWLGLPGLGYQFGHRATHNQLHGDDTLDSAAGHSQNFVTAGLFHRKAVGLQYGVVYDLLRDERQQAADFGQVRGLISVTNPRGHELGFQFASKMSETTIDTITYQATDQYLLFYRKHGPMGGEVRVFGGLDDDSKGILGADGVLPLTDSWSIRTGFTYV
ncbi:MAG: DUF6666 family protein, partial [Planctomycetota bacterium]